MDQSPGSLAGKPPSKTRRTIRVRVACLRCQRRKIRCDGIVPSCGSCTKAGVECIDGGNLDSNSSESPRAYIASLRNRVQWLESIIRTKCPEVDLTQGPSSLLNELGQNEGIYDQESFQHNNIPLPLSSTIHVQAQEESWASSRAEAASSTQNVLPADGISTTPNEQQAGLVHEIGLVSLSAGADPKYIGPSSGFLLAKLLLVCARQGPRGSGTQRHEQNATGRPASLLQRGPISVPPTPLPENKDDTIRISDAYFETIHLQYPFLHQPSHMELIESIYSEAEPSPIAAFHVYMVLAIGATVLSRRFRIPISGEGFCASAMKYFDRIGIEHSLKGLQSLLLLLVYTLNNSSLGLNVWYLNYQCIAAVLDLGLQRDVKHGGGMSLLEQEMRTRTFWVIYSLDRSVATIMGRPIGLRDEACELRLPADVEDSDLTLRGIQPRLEGGPPTHMSCAVHLFKLAQLNSEIKYILHSISHEAPPYCYPKIPDILQWQRGMVARLQTWADQIPELTDKSTYMTQLCEAKYHGIMMLLLRPSPALPNPSVESLRSCHESAVASLRVYDQLYRKDLLIYSWVTIHAIFLSTITMLHCIWTVPAVSADVKLDVLMADLKAGSNVLSASGEHWPEAKRSRDVLDELSGITVRWIIESRARNADFPRLPRPVNGLEAASNGTSADGNAYQAAQYAAADFHAQSAGISINGQQPMFYNHSQGRNLSHDGQYLGTDFSSSLFSEYGADQLDFTNPAAVDVIMQGVFTDFQPYFDFGLGLELDQMMGIRS